MKLSKLNPFIPKDKFEQEIFCATYKRELHAYRKKPTFWCSMLVVLVLSLFMIYRLDLTGRLLVLPIVFGLACIHDTITSHFTKRLVEMENKQQSNEAAEEGGS